MVAQYSLKSEYPSPKQETTMLGICTVSRPLWRTEWITTVFWPEDKKRKK